MQRSTLGALVSLCMLSLSAGAAAAAEVQGRLDWARRAELSTLASGVVAEVKVNAGDRVREGSELLRLDQGALRAGLKEAKARLAFQEKARAEAEREWERTQELYDRTLLANHDLELAQIALARAEAEYRAAQTALAEARQQLDYSRIEAPFAGVVLETRAVAGQTVNTRLQSVPLITLAASGQMLVRLQLGETELARIEPGDSVPVVVDGQRYAGRVHHLGLEPVAGQGAWYPVEVVFAPSAESDLRAGQKATVELP